ncbi:MAG: cell division protein FtsA, partial [Spirochaetota bacterium]|nr:cell division protein FtsA [Spirochaetota bacterium]
MLIVTTLPRDYTICGLDIGSSNIRAIVAQKKSDGPKPQVLGVAQVSASGMRRGVVVDIEETVKDIKKVIKEVERTSGMPFDDAYISIGGTHISCCSSRGVVAVSRADGEISPEDVDRVITAAQAISLGQNREIIHILPRYFIVDGQDMIKDPVSMNGIRLEVDTLIIHGSSPFIKNLNKCIKDADISINELVFAPLAAAYAVLNRRQKELGVLVLDFGGGTTGLTVFEEGDMIHSQVLPVGSAHITNDIAIGLRTSIDVAERVKLEYGSALPWEINKKETIDLTKVGGEGEVSRHELAEIIEARVNEIIDLVNKELKKIDRQGLLPAGIVLVGGGAK